MGNHQKTKKHQDSVAQHRTQGRTARCLIVTISDSRRPENDHSGDRMAELTTAGGHQVCARQIVADESDLIRAAIAEGIQNPEIDVVLTNGGTGIAARDVTPEVVAELLDRSLDGFGELFRSLSFSEIGSAAMLSRAIGGVSGGTLIFSLPGSTKAVELGMTKLVVPELGHLIGLLDS